MLHNALVQNQTTSDSWQQLLEMPRKSWWARLPFGVRMTAGTSALLIAIGAGAAGVAALTKDREQAPRVVTAVGEAQAAPHEAAGRPAPPPAAVSRMNHATGRRTAENDQADRTGTRAPRRDATAQAPARTVAGAPAPAKNIPAGPVTTTRTDVETRAIPFRTRLVRDPSMPRGAKRVQTPGVPGEETLRYLVTVVDGQPADRKLIDTTVTREPQHRVVAYGSARRGGSDQDGGGVTQGNGIHRDRRCGFRLCVPLGRKACEKDEESALQLGGSVVVLDRDIELLDPETLEGLPGVTC